MLPPFHCLDNKPQGMGMIPPILTKATVLRVVWRIPQPRPCLRCTHLGSFARAWSRHMRS